MVIGVAIAADDLDGAAAGAVGLLGRLIFRQRRGQAQPEAVLIVFRGTGLVGGVEGAAASMASASPASSRASISASCSWIMGYCRIASPKARRSAA